VAFKKNVAKDYLNKNCDININDIPFVIKQITSRKEVNINEKKNCCHQEYGIENSWRGSLT
jgi:hypothetical protein